MEQTFQGKMCFACNTFREESIINQKDSILIAWGYSVVWPVQTCCLRGCMETTITRGLGPRNRDSKSLFLSCEERKTLGKKKETEEGRKILVAPSQPFSCKKNAGEKEPFLRAMRSKGVINLRLKIAGVV